MNDYHFSAELAKRYGLDEAIMLHHFAYWVQKNTCLLYTSDAADE